MGKELNNPRNIIKTLKKFRHYAELTEQSGHLGKNYPSEDFKGLDSRNIFLFVFLRHGINLSDKEFLKRYDEVFNDFINNPDKLVNEYMNWYEKIDYKNLSSRSNKKTLELIMVNRWSQQYGTIFDNNKKAFEDRYQTQEQKMFSDSLTAINTLYCSALTPLMSLKTQMDINKIREYSKEDFEFVLENRDADKDAFENASMNLGKIADYIKGKKDTVELDYSDVNNYSREIFKRTRLGDRNAQVPEEYKNAANNDTIYSLLDGSLLNANTISGKIVKPVKENELKSIYIDGKNLHELVMAEKDVKPNNHKMIAGYLLAEAAHNGKAIDVCQSYLENDGRISTKIIPISFKPDEKTLNKMHDEYMKKNHPIRYRFFNWGPFRLKKVNPMKLAKEENMKNLKERHAGIFEHRNTVFLDELNSKLDKKLEVGRLIEGKQPIENNKSTFISKITTRPIQIQDNELGIEIQNNDNIIIDNELTKGEQVKEV